MASEKNDLFDMQVELEVKKRIAEMSESDFKAMTNTEHLKWALQMVQDQGVKISEMMPKAEFSDHVTKSLDLVNMREAAGLLDFKGLGRNNLFILLRNERILTEGGSDHNLPMRTYIETGYFAIKETAWTDPETDVTHVTTVCFITQKGIMWLTQKLKRMGYEQIKR